MVENGKESSSLNENKNNNDEDEEEELCSILPINCLPLTHQVAGHFYGKGKTKLGLLQTNDGLVLKPVQSPPRGEREHNFFKRLFTASDVELNADEMELRSLLPTYRGSFIHNDTIYIKMDDLAHGIQHPSVIDFKIGRITHDPEATVEKINRQKKKYPPCEKIGFQLIGMRVFNSADNSFAHYDKVFGRSLSEEDLVHGLALFYQFHQTPQIRAIKATIERFEEILVWFRKQTTYHFFSSSLIVVYDANLESILNSNNSNSNQINSASASVATASAINMPFVRVIMADFAHVFPANNKSDENYIYGLDNLIVHLKMLLKPDYKFKDVRDFY